MKLIIRIKKFIGNNILLVFAGVLAACGGQLFHVVERGETLYSIGFSYGYDYRQIAEWNNISPPYALNPGQRLRVAPPLNGSVEPLPEEAVVATVRQPTSSSPEKSSTNQAPAPVVEGGKPAGTDEPNAARKLVNNAKQWIADQYVSWQWPVKEKRILSTFSSNNPARQGLDLAGEQGNPVFVAANGKVVYAGSGLVRYGQLIIVKHNEKFLSAYAHNHVLHVKEGQEVKAGDKIADMGSSGTTRTKLHFEIRLNGEPVDPLKYLPR